MKTSRFLALLRGINVGGKNIIRMEDLRTCFSDLGFQDVRTCIQSGNVLFRSETNDLKKLAGKIENALSENFNYHSSIHLLTSGQLQAVVSEAPSMFGKEPGNYKYDVIFLKAPFLPMEVLKKVSVKEGVDQASAGRFAMYFSRLSAKAVQSRLKKIMEMPEYQFMTIRNWNTVTRLLHMMDNPAE